MRHPEHILVHRIGQLGDSVVALPALWVVRESFPDARITLLTNGPASAGRAQARDVLENAGVVDDVIVYRASARSAWRTLRELRRRRFDTLAYLAPSQRSARQVLRDRLYFRLAGVRRFLGMRGFASLPERGRSETLPKEADLLLARLAADGLAVPSPNEGRMELGIALRERAGLERWLRTLPPDRGRPWIAVGPGSQMPAKRWPEARFHATVAQLVRHTDAWPVVFGGPEDVAAAERLVAGWGRGYSAAGRLTVREAAAGLERCALYVGNDTGTMHLAAAAGTPCVGVYSAREWRGLWFPYGAGHRPMQREIECQGCGLTECVEREQACLREITVEEVVSECLPLLEERVQWKRPA